MFKLVKADLYKTLKRWMPYVLLFVLLGYMTYVMSSDYSSSENFLEKYPWLTYSDYVEAVEQADEGETAITIIHYNEEDGTTMHLNIGTNAFEDVVLPDAMSNKFSYMSIAGTLLLILTASVLGTEYK